MYGFICTACMSVEAKRRGCWMLGSSGTKDDWGCRENSRHINVVLHFSTADTLFGPLSA